MDKWFNWDGIKFSLIVTVVIILICFIIGLFPVLEFNYRVCYPDGSCVEFNDYEGNPCR